MSRGCELVVAATSAGISEGTVFRGYLQQQFTAWTGHVSVGILGQAALFGLVHEYEGRKNMALIFVLGGILGVSARLRKRLRGNVLAHASMDILSAF
jgi:membrane protease YdiL (CAAX protease family)